MGVRVGRKLYGQGNGAYLYHCPGCGELHVVHVEHPNHLGACWTFNRNGDTPTFSPSVLVTWDWRKGDIVTKQVCHHFVREGRIEFLGDCTHALAGKTVDLPDWSSEW